MDINTTGWKKFKKRLLDLCMKESHDSIFFERVQQDIVFYFWQWVHSKDTFSFRLDCSWSRFKETIRTDPVALLKGFLRFVGWCSIFYIPIIFIFGISGLIGFIKWLFIFFIVVSIQTLMLILLIGDKDIFAGTQIRDNLSKFEQNLLEIVVYFIVITTVQFFFAFFISIFPVLYNLFLSYVENKVVLYIFECVSALYI